MKKVIILAVMAIIAYACSNNAGSKNDSSSASGNGTENPSYDPKRGTGKFTNVEVPAALDVDKADGGQKVYEVKCSSCHKLTDEKLVGPGWKGVTGRHTAEWIMNFATNPDEMLQKDTAAQSMLEICLVRMPNQNLTDDEARNAFEFMRKNDGVK
jgi:cytochrome c5